MSGLRSSPERFSRRKPASGFTLIELLVVIAIITVLIAITLPVYRGAREHAQQRSCMANLYQIATAIRMYRIEEGAYPGPYEPVTGEGGINVLYPYYLADRSALICPDDETDSGEKYYEQNKALLDSAQNMYYYNWRDPGFFSENYSSYNALYNWLGYVQQEGDYNLLSWHTQHMNAGDSLAWWYEWYRWDPEGVLYSADPSRFSYADAFLHYQLAQQVYWWNYVSDPYSVDDPTRLLDNLGRPLWDVGDSPDSPGNLNVGWYPFGQPSAVFPGLMNRNAPDNTIVTRCPHHRAWTIVRIPRDKSEAGTAGSHGGMGDKSRGGMGTERDNTPQDIVVRLDGSCALVRGYGYSWATQPR